MKKDKVVRSIESALRTQVRTDKTIKNAFLLVSSEKLGVALNIAEGKSRGGDSNPQQPVHMASVGKLFTATIMGILHDEGKVLFDDKISKYLDAELMHDLHVFRGKNYSDEITVTHLLNQTSGLADVFFPLYEKAVKDSSFKISTREAIIWGKKNLAPRAMPGEKHLYTDTNYFLLGLIIENVLGMPFQEVLHQLIFEPLGMKHAYTNDFSKPAEETSYATAEAFIDKVDFTNLKGIAPLDHAGSSVIAPLEEYLIFMRALVSNTLLKAETFNRMISDDKPMSFPAIGMRYGYSIWKFVTVPFLMPVRFNCWGCVGVTGAYMFYHPQTESFIIGTFNDSSYKVKALRFMLSTIIGNLLKITEETH